MRSVFYALISKLFDQFYLVEIDITFFFKDIKIRKIKKQKIFG
jgi:hypothetical protein